MRLGAHWEADPLLAWQARYGHFVNVDALDLGWRIVIAQAPSRRAALRTVKLTMDLLICVRPRRKV